LKIAADADAVREALSELRMQSRFTIGCVSVRLKWMSKEFTMTHYEPGDYIKTEFKDDETNESEWMWVRVDSADDATVSCSVGVCDQRRFREPPILSFPESAKLSFQMVASFMVIPIAAAFRRRTRHTGELK
jgi:hypothetical protein